MKNISSSFIKLFNKIAKFDKSAGIYENGVGNNYPELVESTISNSVTASRCAALMSSYITGKGFGEDENKLIVNEKKNITLLQFTQEIGDSISEQNGVFIHLNYNGHYEISSMDVIPFGDCRIGKKDDDNYAGKVFVCDDWSSKKTAKKAQAIDVFNPDKKIIESQANKAGGIKRYSGQVFYFKFGKYTYPLSPVHAGLKDAESETQASIYKHISLKKGFFGKTLVVTKPLVDNDIKDSDHDEYNAQVSERDAFRKTIKEFIGAENADGVMHLEMEFESDKLEDEILFKQVESNINDKLFAHTENSVRDNIMMCFNNVPSALIKSQDGKLFGSSGEAIREMKLFYQDQTNNERMIVESIVNRLMNRFHLKKDNLKIIKLIDDANR